MLLRTSSTLAMNVSAATSTCMGEWSADSANRMEGGGALYSCSVTYLLRVSSSPRRRACSWHERGSVGRSAYLVDHLLQHKLLRGAVEPGGLDADVDKGGVRVADERQVRVLPQQPDEGGAVAAEGGDARRFRGELAQRLLRRDREQRRHGTRSSSTPPRRAAGGPRRVPRRRRSPPTRQGRGTCPTSECRCR